MNALALGAGASEGLEQYLLQMLKERQLQDEERRTTESIRSNQAGELLQGQQIDESARYRQAQQEAAALTQQSMIGERNREEANRVRDDQRAILDDLIPGVMFTEDERNRYTQSGATAPQRFSLEDFDTPDPKAIESGVPESLAQNEPAFRLNAAPSASSQGEVSWQRDTMLVDGKPQDVFINPRTRQVTTLTGQDVTAKAQHYEKPPQIPQQLFSPVQSGDEYLRFNRRTGQFEDPQSGQAMQGGVPLATTGSTRTMQEGAAMIRPHIEELEGLAQQLDKAGLFGPVMGRIRDLSARFGTTGSPEDIQKSSEDLANAISSDPAINTDRLTGQFATTLALMASGAGRVHGGARGGGSIQMISYMKQILSGTSSLQMFLGRMDALDSYLKTYAAGVGGVNSTGTPTAPDAYEEYLKRFPR